MVTHTIKIIGDIDNRFLPEKFPDWLRDFCATPIFKNHSSSKHGKMLLVISGFTRSSWSRSLGTRTL